MLKSHAIELKGPEADEVIKLLNKMFGGEEEQKEPTEVSGPVPVPEKSDYLKTAEVTKGLFDAHVAVGFNEYQALEFVKAIIMA